MVVVLCRLFEVKIEVAGCRVQGAGCEGTTVRRCDGAKVRRYDGVEGARGVV